MPPLADRPDRPRQVVERRLLDEEPARAGVEGLEQERALGMAGVEDDRGLRPLCAELASNVNAADSGHADVHDGDVRSVLLDQPQGLVAVLRPRDDLDILDVREISGDGVDDRGVIVGDDAAPGHSTLLFTTKTGSSGRLDPATSATRSAATGSNL